MGEFVEEITEKPFVAVVSDRNLTSVCSFCFRRSDKLHRCSGCKVLYYCSKTCQCLQASDWSIHKFECPCLLKGVANHEFRLMARAIWKVKTGVKTDPDQPYRTFDDLMSHADEWIQDSVKASRTVELYWLQLRSYMRGETFMTASAYEMMQLYTKVFTNAFIITICGSETDFAPVRLGGALYLKLSVIDHSCDPNAWIYFDGAKAVLRPLQNGLSLHDLGKIRIKYWSIMTTLIKGGPKDKRQKELKFQYSFDCKCTRCSNGKDERDVKMVGCNCPRGRQCSCHVKEHMQMVINAETNLEALMLKHKDFAKLRKVAGDLLSACKDLGQFNYYRMLLIEYLFEACIGLKNDWPAACEYGYMILEYYRFEYSAEPKLLFHLLKLSKVLVAADEPEHQVMQMLEEAERMCAQCYGKEHKLYKEINVAKQQAELGLVSMEGWWHTLYTGIHARITNTD